MLEVVYQDGSVLKGYEIEVSYGKMIVDGIYEVSFDEITSIVAVNEDFEQEVE